MVFCIVIIISQTSKGLRETYVSVAQWTNIGVDVEIAIYAY